jgi:hypothetical protein
MGRTLFASLSLSATLSLGHASVEFPSSGACITQHLKEAMVLNRERMPRYATLSNGRSNEIIRDLISLEQQMLIPSKILDRLARKYHQEGIPVFCQDMMPMHLTPDFESSYRDGAPALKDYITPSARHIKADLRRGLREGGFAGLDYQAMKWYRVYAQEPRFNCMIRHFLESTVRSARLAQKYDQYAQDNKLNSPNRLMLRYLQLSFLSFSQAISLDRRAAPLQAQGIPILCQDVPHIPFDSSWPK